MKELSLYFWCYEWKVCTRLVLLLVASINGYYSLGMKDVLKWIGMKRLKVQIFRMLVLSSHSEMNPDQHYSEQL